MTETTPAGTAARRAAWRWLFGLVASALVLAAALILGAGNASSVRLQGPAAVRITAYPILSFRIGSDETRFGDLTFLGGVELRGAHSGFGGVSALRLLPDGAGFLALTDLGNWLTGRVTRDGARVTGLADVTISPILGPGGRQAKAQGLWDAESIAMDGGRVFVGIEREHAVLAFPDTTPTAAAGTSLPLPPLVRRWWSNRGIEAMGVLPAGSPHAGWLIAFSERSDMDLTEGFVMPPDRPDEAFRLRLRRRDGFDVTDLAVLPGGDLVLLERFFSPLRGVAMRLRRIALADIRPGATLDGDVLLTASGRNHHVDNMEGLAIRRTPEGAVIFTMVSDDNFSVVQRTLLLEFRYDGRP